MADFDFVCDDHMDASHQKSVDFRPGRMGLGFNIDNLRKKQKQDAEKKKLANKILGKKRRSNESSDEEDKTIHDESESEYESKSNMISKRLVVNKTQELLSAQLPLSKSQKKRMRQKRIKDANNV